MGFIIRSAFWLSLVLLIIPIGGGAEDGTPAVSPIQAFFAAREAVTDIAGMCERKPEVCAVGRSAVHTIGVRARESARIAANLLDEDRSGPEIVTGSIEPAALPDAAPLPSQPVPN